MQSSDSMAQHEKRRKLAQHILLWTLCILTLPLHAEDSPASLPQLQEQLLSTLQDKASSPKDLSTLLDQIELRISQQHRWKQEATFFDKALRLANDDRIYTRLFDDWARAKLAAVGSPGALGKDADHQLARKAAKYSQAATQGASVEPTYTITHQKNETYPASRQQPQHFSRINTTTPQTSTIRESTLASTSNRTVQQNVKSSVTATRPIMNPQQSTSSIAKINNVPSSKHPATAQTGTAPFAHSSLNTATLSQTTMSTHAPTVQTPHGIAKAGVRTVSTQNPMGQSGRLKSSLADTAPLAISRTSTIHKLPSAAQASSSNSLTSVASKSSSASAVLNLPDAHAPGIPPNYKVAVRSAASNIQAISANQRFASPKGTSLTNSDIDSSYAASLQISTKAYAPKTAAFNTQAAHAASAIAYVQANKTAKPSMNGVAPRDSWNPSRTSPVALAEIHPDISASLQLSGTDNRVHTATSAASVTLPKTQKGISERANLSQETSAIPVASIQKAALPVTPIYGTSSHIWALSNETPLPRSQQATAKHQTGYLHPQANIVTSAKQHIPTASGTSATRLSQYDTRPAMPTVGHAASLHTSTQSSAAIFGSIMPTSSMLQSTERFHASTTTPMQTGNATHLSSSTNGMGGVQTNLQPLKSTVISAISPTQTNPQPPVLTQAESFTKSAQTSLSVVEAKKRNHAQTLITDTSFVRSQTGEATPFAQTSRISQDIVSTTGTHAAASHSPAIAMQGASSRIVPVAFQTPSVTSSQGARIVTEENSYSPRADMLVATNNATRATISNASMPVPAAVRVNDIDLHKDLPGAKANRIIQNNPSTNPKVAGIPVQEKSNTSNALALHTKAMKSPAVLANNLSLPPAVAATTRTTNIDGRSARTGNTAIAALSSQGSTRQPTNVPVAAHMKSALPDEELTALPDIDELIFLQQTISEEAELRGLPADPKSEAVFLKGLLAQPCKRETLHRIVHKSLYNYLATQDEGPERYTELQTELLRASHKDNRGWITLIIAQAAFDIGYREVITPILKRLDEEKPLAAELHQSALLMESLALFQQAKRNEARQLLQTYLTKYPDGEAQDKARFLIAWSHMVEDNPRKALQGFELVMRRYPESDYAPRAKALAERLRTLVQDEDNITF